MAIPYLDLIQGIGIEEISHVELISKTISRLLDGAPEYHGKKFDVPGKGGKATMDMAKEQQNPHHFIVGAQGALPVDAAGNPWSGSYVHYHGNLVFDLMDNLVLEATGRLQKCRIYQMSENATLRATVSFLIVRDEAHQAAFARALETLGVNWGKVLPIPKFDSSKYPEVKKLLDAGIHREQYHFRLDGSQMEKIFSGPAPFGDKSELVTLKEPRKAILFRWRLNGLKNLLLDLILNFRNWRMLFQTLKKVWQRVPGITERNQKNKLIRG